MSEPSPTSSHHYTGLQRGCLPKRLWGSVASQEAPEYSFILGHFLDRWQGKPSLLCHLPTLKKQNLQPELLLLSFVHVHLHNTPCLCDNILCVNYKWGFWLSKTYSLFTSVLNLNAFLWCWICKALYPFVLCFTVNDISRDDCLHLVVTIYICINLIKYLLCSTSTSIFFFSTCFIKPLPV